MKNVGNSSCGRSQGVPKIFRAPMYRAHCTVIFALAQLPCSFNSQTFLFTPGYISSLKVNFWKQLQHDIFFRLEAFL